MEFRCRLGRASGEVVEGVYAAEDEAQLRRALEQKGLLVLSLHPRRGLQRSRVLRRPGASVRRNRRVGRREFIVFNQELATLLKAGLPLVESLDILRRRVDDPPLRAMLDDVHGRVRSGEALSEAFAAQAPAVPGVYTASLLAGEKSGSLEQVVRRYAAHARVLAEVRRKTLSALIYPALLLALSLLVIAIIVLQVVPEFAGFYGGLGAELPLVTRAILGVSELVRGHFAVLALVFGLAGGGLWAWMRRPGRSALVDRLLLRVPLAGAVTGKYAASQLSRTLATLLGGGLPLVDALDVAGRAIGNRHVAGELDTVSREVREGQALSASMAARGVFPPVAVKMVEVGESTGALQEMLDSAADFFDEEIDTTLGRLMTLIEPVLLVVMGVVIAGMLLALYMPLLQLGTLVR